MTTCIKRLGRPAKNKMLEILDIQSGVFLRATAAPFDESNINASGCEFQEVHTFVEGLTVNKLAFQRRKKQGGRCFALKYRHRILSAGWVSGPGCEANILYEATLTVPPGAVYVWDCHTAPEARGQGHYQTLLRCLRGLPAPGSSVYVAVDTFNAASRRAMENTGFKSQFRYAGCRFMGRSLGTLALKSHRLMRAQTALGKVAQGEERAP